MGNFSKTGSHHKSWHLCHLKRGFLNLSLRLFDWRLDFFLVEITRSVLVSIFLMALSIRSLLLFFFRIGWNSYSELFIPMSSPMPANELRYAGELRLMCYVLLMDLFNLYLHVEEFVQKIQQQGRLRNNSRSSKAEACAQHRISTFCAHLARWTLCEQTPLHLHFERWPSLILVVSESDSKARVVQDFVYKILMSRFAWQMRILCWRITWYSKIAEEFAWILGSEARVSWWVW
jgi:hypothetical protein